MGHFKYYEQISLGHFELFERDQIKTKNYPRMNFLDFGEFQITWLYYLCHVFEKFDITSGNTFVCIQSLKIIQLTFHNWIFRRWSLFDLQWWLSHDSAVLGSNQLIDATDRFWIRQQYSLSIYHQWYKLHPMFEWLNTMKSLWKSFKSRNSLISREQKSNWVWYTQCIKNIFGFFKRTWVT